MTAWHGQHDPAALADILRRRLGKLSSIAAADLAEKRMFGGVCFLLRGNMLCGTAKNGYMFRLDAARSAAAASQPGATPVVMRGRAMAGFFWVEPAACDSRALGRWLALAIEHVGSLPAKAGRAAIRKRRPARKRAV